MEGSALLPTVLSAPSTTLFLSSSSFSLSPSVWDRVETLGRRENIRQAWEHQAMEGVETLGRRGNTRQLEAWRHRAGMETPRRPGIETLRRSSVENTAMEGVKTSGRYRNIRQ